MEGENGFKIYLTFDGFLLWVFSLLRASEILYSLAWRHRLSSCPRFFLLFPGVSATVSIHLVTPTVVLKLGSVSSPGVWHQITCPLTAISVLKLNSLFLFPLTKRVLLPALGFWPIIWPLSSSSPCQAIRSGYYTDFCMSPFPSTRLQSVSSSWLSFWPGFVASFNRQAEELTYIRYSSFKGQSLRPVNSNTERLGKFLISRDIRFTAAYINRNTDSNAYRKLTRFAWLVYWVSHTLYWRGGSMQWRRGVYHYNRYELQNLSTIPTITHKM